MVDMRAAAEVCDMAVEADLGLDDLLSYGVYSRLRSYVVEYLGGG